MNYLIHPHKNGVALMDGHLYVYSSSTSNQHQKIERVNDPKKAGVVINLTLMCSFSDTAMFKQKRSEAKLLH